MTSEAAPTASAGHVPFDASDFAEIIDSSPIAMFLATTGKGILHANEAAADLTGRPIDEMLGARLLHTVVHPDDVANVMWVGPEVTAGNPTDVRHRLLTADGAVRHIRGSITPIFKDGELRYGVAQYVDDTELVVASRELAKQRELLASFAAVVAHDLRSPIAGIVGFADLLQREHETLPESAVEIVEMMLESAREASATIGRTLERSLGERRSAATSADLTEIIDRVSSLVSPNLAAAGGRLTYVGGVRFLRADPEVLSEILLNLCQNSIKYRSERSPEITIRVDVSHETLHVIDNGRGIPPAKRELVFQRGFQTAASDDGHGLGLARVRELVEDMGGTIVATDSASGGTEMLLSLPGSFIRGDG